MELPYEHFYQAWFQLVQRTTTTDGDDNSSHMILWSGDLTKFRLGC